MHYGDWPRMSPEGRLEHDCGILITREIIGASSWIIDSISDTEAVLHQEKWDGRASPVPGKTKRLKRI